VAAFDGAATFNELIQKTTGYPAKNQQKASYFQALNELTIEDIKGIIKH
jgi:hypothetical protein